MPWHDATCSGNYEFMVPKSTAENSFIYDNFVKPEGFSLWMNARKGGECGQNICDKNGMMLDYINNNLGKDGCVQMKNGKNGDWTVNTNCNGFAFYICKYSEYSFRKIVHS